MEPLFPQYADDAEYDDWDDMRETAIAAATKLTTAAIKARLITEGESLKATSDRVMNFFTTAYRRIRELDDDYIDNSEGNGEG